MAYRPTFRSQMGDPTTTLDGYICTFSSGAMALDYHTLGRIKVWGGTLYQKGGVNARDGGTLTELAKCWAAYGQTLDIETLKTMADLKAALKAGRAAVVQGDYDQFTLATRCQDSFLGDHAVLLLPEFSGTKVLMGDPLCKTWKWVEWSEITRYMEKLGRRVLGTSSPQRVFYAVTRAHTPTVPTYPYGSRRYSLKIRVTAPKLNARKAPSLTSTVKRTYTSGTVLTTTYLTTTAGAYRYNGATRKDWYGIKQPDGTYLWIARAYTRLV